MTKQTKLQKRVVARIRKALAEKNTSADRLALEIGLSTGYFSEFLNGKKDATLKVIERIADGLEIDPKELF